MDMHRRYVRSGVHAVGGWMEHFTPDLISSISLIQRAEGIKGSVGEIGVHHGKLFLILHTSADPGTPSFAVDLFQDQHLNTDKSGRGDYGRFMKNVGRWAGRTDDIRIFQGSSLELDPQKILDTCGPARFFSIDGGHTLECTLNDLQIAERTLTNDGVVVLDDVFNPAFPEVSMGLAAYVETGALHPFMISPGKVYLARLDQHERYRTLIRKRWPHEFEKTAALHGAQVDIYRISFGFEPAWKRAIMSSPFYPQLRTLKKRLDGSSPVPPA
jgi:hypothetical protein